jgi:cytochrome c
MRFEFFLAFGVTALAGLVTASVKQRVPENNPPAVRIISPTNNSKFQVDSVIPYSILVSDKEDGNSAYNEISVTEVLLFVTYISDSSKVKNHLLNQSLTNQEPLLWMSTSTCFNCHASKNKLIGPSFESIAKRYADDPAPVESLAKKIIAGSSGTWSDVKMPPHPELQIDQAKKLVRWILENNSNPDQTFYAGIEGSIPTRDKPSKERGNGVYILTATYTDHGLKGIERSSKKGMHTIMLKNY